jgi:hypothetical protein
MKNIILITLTILSFSITYGQESKNQEYENELIEKQIQKEMQKIENEIDEPIKAITNKSKSTFARTTSGTTTYYGTNASTAGLSNTNYGYLTGNTSTDTATDNTSIGARAGRSITSGKYNSFVGRAAGYNNKTGIHNSFFGMNSGYKTEDGTYNLAMGSYSFFKNTSGLRNVALGVNALRSNITGNDNTNVGYASGYKSLGSGNVNIGSYAGYHNTSSNKLYIDNSTTSTPLIYGDFATNRLGINNNNPNSHLDVNGSMIVDNQASSHSSIRIGHDSQDRIYADNSSNKTYGGGYFFRVSKSGDEGYINALMIADNGNIGIGTKSSNNTAKLTVKGDIHATEIKVKVDAGADFVFANDYSLPTLASVEAFITKNKHLPTIAPANKMETEGLELGEMNIRLLQKVEELTLYTIQQEKKLQKLTEALLKIEQNLAAKNK